MDSPRGLLIAFFLILVPCAAAGERWTVGDLVTAEEAADWAVSPNGRLAVWVRSTVETVGGEEKRVENLWLSRLDAEARPRPLTRGRDTTSAPAFSPDGRHVAFLSDREPPDAQDDGDDDTGPQLWAIPTGGGEAFAVSRFERPVEAFGWIDGETLAVLAEEAPSAWERQRKEAKDTTIVVEDALRQPPVRLFRVTLEGEARRLTANDDWLDELAVSPDGRWAVVTAQQSLSYDFDSKIPPHTYLVELESGTRRRLLEPAAGDRPLLPAEVRWALDSSGFYFVDFFSRHPLYRMATVSRLWFYDLAADRAMEVDLGWPRGLGEGYAPVRGGFLVLLADGVRQRPARYTKEGSSWRRQELDGAHVPHIDDLATGADGVTVVYEHSSATLPTQGYAARLDGARLVGERRITDLNAGWKDKPTGRVEVVRWTGALDEEVEGLLFHPLDRSPDEGPPRMRPLILDIHGGPASVDRDSWPSRHWGVPGLLFRQRGAYVLQVNYHGSSDYGLDWVESIAGRYYELEIPDIEAGVDAMIERGLVDPERLGVAGWSNGGILAAELITRTSRYRAASVGAADVEWASDWANVDFGAAFDNYYFGVPPWEDPQLYVEKSPFYRLMEVVTPTIVFTGTEDRNVPPHQSWSLFRALQQLERAPARLVLFPGEPHSLKKVAHQRRKIEEDLAWFDRYLFDREPEGMDAVMPDSPLAALLARSRAARHGGHYGVEVAGRLVPETVTSEVLGEGLQVGRFEVTRAQWRELDPELSIAPGEGDLPVTGVSLERAEEYVRWLSEVTGRRFRLPTREQAEKLSEWAADRGENGDGNTLDHWAGYSPNPEDREAILEALAGAGRAALLAPVGSFPGAGEPAVFDLDGNAAEWAVGEGGAGVAIGPSADRSSDPMSAAPPAPEYVGLRVVEVVP